MGEMLKDPETYKSMLEDREAKPSDEISETQKNKDLSTRSTTFPRLPVVRRFSLSSSVNLYPLY